MLSRHYLLLLILLASLLGACSNVPYRERQQQRLAEYQKYAGDPVEKFHFFHLEDWEVLGPNTIALRTSLRDSYLITVEKVCNQLEWANTVGVTSSSIAARPKLRWRATQSNARSAGKRTGFCLSTTGS